MVPPAEIAVHPTDGDGKHELYFMCEDLEVTLKELTAAGAEVSGTPRDLGWGRLAEISLPSGSKLSLYEPRHPVAYNLA
jgi:predicted enzyme related to lactoylglutathione lyase